MSVRLYDVRMQTRNKYLSLALTHALLNEFLAFLLDALNGLLQRGGGGRHCGLLHALNAQTHKQVSTVWKRENKRKRQRTRGGAERREEGHREK